VKSKMAEPLRIPTDRLQLVETTLEFLQADLAGPEALGRALGAHVPKSWPPNFYDDDAIRYTIARLEENPDAAGWWGFYALLTATAERPTTLIGAAGYKGPPAQGAVEIGYGIVEEYQRQRFATEAAQALIDRAFSASEVDAVLAETMPELVGSIGVLGKCGFTFIGEGSEPGVIRYELRREHWAGKTVEQNHELPVSNVPTGRPGAEAS
jgi:ribosomal-protein-alanine N-acetyltransferase